MSEFSVKTPEHEKPSRLQIWLFAIIAIVAAICIAFFFLASSLKEPIQYSLGDSIFKEAEIGSPDYETDFTATNSTLQAIRVPLAEVSGNVEENDESSIAIEIMRGEDVLYKESKPLKDAKPNTWLSFSIDLNVDEGSSYSLRMYQTGDADIKVHYTSDEDPKPALSFGYDGPLTLLDKGLCALFVVIIALLCCYIVWCLPRIKAFLRMTKDRILCNDWTVFPQSIVAPILFVVTLKLSGLEIDKVLLCLIAILCFVGFNWCLRKMDEVEEMFATTGSKMGAVALSLYVAFALVGSRCFIYPIDMQLTLFNVVVFLGTAVMCAPIVIWALAWIERGSVKYLAPENNRLSKKAILFCSAIFIIGAVFYIRAYNPAISSNDTRFCMQYAANSIIGMPDWHPPFYVLCLKAILKIWDSIYAVVIAQYLFFALVFFRGAAFLARRGIRQSWLIVLCALTVLNCSVMVHLTTIWKDVPYTISLLWLTIVCAVIATDREKSRWYVYVELAIALVLCCYLRQNGIVVYVLATVVLVVVFRRNWRLIASVCVALAMVLFVRYPLYDYMQIEREPNGGKYIGLGQDILGVYYNGGNISDEAMYIVETLTDGDVEGLEYTPYYAKSSYDLDIPITEFIGAYVDTFVKNPVLMTRTIICRQDAVWDIFLGENGSLSCVAYTGTSDNDQRWTDLWPTRQKNCITVCVDKLVALSTKVPLLNVLEWRSGIWLVLSVLALGVLIMFKKDKRLLVMALPLVGQILSLVLTTGWSDFRYYWPINLMLVFIFLYVLTMKSKVRT